MTKPGVSRPVTEAGFEPLLAIRIEVMREHPRARVPLRPRAARRVFREHFAEPGLRLILVDDEIAGCVGFRLGEAEIKIDPSISRRRHHNRGLGAEILKVLLAEADAIGLPCELDVLLGSPADRFYERHGFAKQGQDDIESHLQAANFLQPVGSGH